MQYDRMRENDERMTCSGRVRTTRDATLQDRRYTTCIPFPPAKFMNTMEYILYSLYSTSRFRTPSSSETRHCVEERVRSGACRRGEVRSASRSRCQFHRQVPCWSHCECHHYASAHPILKYQTSSDPLFTPFFTLTPWR